MLKKLCLTLTILLAFSSSALSLDCFYNCGNTMTQYQTANVSPPSEGAAPDYLNLAATSTTYVAQEQIMETKRGAQAQFQQIKTDGVTATQFQFSTTGPSLCSDCVDGRGGGSGF